MTVRVTVEQALLIHRAEGAGYLMDHGKLDGAVAAPFATFDGGDLYPALLDQAAKLVQAIVTAHAFTDGNKRLAWDLCVTFLELNGQVLIEIPDAEVDKAVRDLEARRMTREVFALWLSDRIA